MRDAAGLKLEGDRRTAVRFPVAQDVRYRLFVGKSIQTGTGRSINMSSNGMLFTVEHRLAIGQHLDVTMNWPVHLETGEALQLVISGQVVRREPGLAAVSIDRYEFHTQGRHGRAPRA